MFLKTTLQIIQCLENEMRTHSCKVQGIALMRVTSLGVIYDSLHRSQSGG